LSAPWLIRFNWDELISMLVCASLDILEYILPFLLTPYIGDIIDFIGGVFCVISFGWLGFVALLEFIPGLDVLPVYTITWLLWYLIKKRKMKINLEKELEKWK
jgi:hypothetical protein